MANPLEILDTGVTMGGNSTGTTSSPTFDCYYPTNFNQSAQFLNGVAGVNTIKVGDTDYILRVGTSGAAGYLTFVLEE